jgi:hypothetical protein
MLLLINSKPWIIGADGSESETETPDIESTTIDYTKCSSLQPITHYPARMALIDDPCNYTFYARYGRVIQLANYLKRAVEINITLFTEEDCRYNASNLVCNSEAHHTEGLDYPLQCNAETHRCECLELPQAKIKTARPIGTSGCLGMKDSFCDEVDRKLFCGFGYHCVKGRCTNSASLIIFKNTWTVMIIVIPISTFVSLLLLNKT